MSFRRLGTSKQIGDRPLLREVIEKTERVWYSGMIVLKKSWQH
jgi:hypothetical protein